MNTIAALGTPIVAVFSALVGIWTWRWQLWKDLFDRRFAVYIEISEFLKYVNACGGEIDVSENGKENHHFLKTKEKADMFFSSTEINQYLTEVHDAACNFNGKKESENDTRGR